MASDALGIDQQGGQPPDLTTDYLGVRSPTAFRGQPALPTGGPIAPGTAAPPTTGAGTSPAGGLTPVASGPLESSTFADLSSAVGGPGESAGQGPAVSEAGSFPASFDLANINLGNLGVVAPDSPVAGVGTRVGPTGTVSGTTGNRVVDSALSILGNQFGVPTAVNLVGRAASLFGGPVLGALAGITGPVGALLTAVQLTHAISSQFGGTLAGQINSIMHDETLTPQMQAQMLADLNNQGPKSGGPQAIGNLAIDNPVTNLGASPNLNTPEAQAQNLSQTPAFAALANALFGSGRTDTGGPSATGPTGPGSVSGPTGPGSSSSGVPGAADNAPSDASASASAPDDGGSGAP